MEQTKEYLPTVGGHGFDLRGKGALTMKTFLILQSLLVTFFSGWIATSSVCMAQEKFPTKPITVIHGYAPGGTGDLPVRYLADFASKKLGQPMVVVNKEGGGGSMAIAELKNLAPDGYNIASYSTGPLLNALMRKVPYHPVKDLEPIIQYTLAFYGLVVQAESPFKTLEDLIVFARANPGKLTYSTTGPGSPQHLTMIRLGDAAKVDWVHIPAESGVQAVTMLLGGHVTACSQATEWKPYVDSGRLRLLALYTEQRTDAYPNVPTLVDLSYNIVAASFRCFVGPRGIPRNRVQILHDALYEGMQTPGYKELLKKFDFPVFHRNPEELGKHLEEIYESSAKVIQKLKQEGKIK
jgi:tripartite-type tricarboxylate transporter receptor subunit TctC